MSFGVLMPVRFSIILAVMDEDRNIKVMLKRVKDLFRRGMLRGLDEIIFVDGKKSRKTREILNRAARAEKNYKIRLLVQKVSPGTVPAQLEGVRRSHAPVVVIMDCDLQHPPEDIPRLLAEKKRGYSLVAASRRLGYESERRALSRVLISRGAQLLAYAYVKGSRKLADPLSGFFVIDRKYLVGLKELPGLNKLLLYIVSAYPNIKVSELDFKFMRRLYGKSKVISSSLRFMHDYLSELRYYHSIEKECRKKNGMGRIMLKYAMES